MADSPRNQWTPEWSVAPGEILGEVLEDRSMSQAELARRMARPLKTISEIANGKAAITPDTAIQLERTLGITAAFWNGLEARYREQIARQRSVEELATYRDWVKRFPVPDMRHRDLISQSGSATEQAEELLTFFEVSNPEGWQRQWGGLAARFRSATARESSVEALATWLRWGEREAASVPVKPYDRSALIDALPDARRLSRLAVFDLAFHRLQALLADAGVALVVLPELSGARVSGATRWTRGAGPMILLNLRYRSDDQFWFSVFHEIGHVTTGRKRDVYLDDLFDGARASGESEAVADRFARDTLIPPADYSLIVDVGEFGSKVVRAFAKSIGIAPGLVVGRLEQDGHLPFGRLGSLKHRYDIAA